MSRAKSSSALEGRETIARDSPLGSAPNNALTPERTEEDKPPEGWSRVLLGDLAEFKNGINFTSAQKGRGTLTVDVLNMYGPGISVPNSGLYRVDVDLEPHYLLKENDVLLVRSSLKRKGVGWATLFRGHYEPVTFCGFLIRARLHDSAPVAPEFLVNCLRLPSIRAQLVAKSDRVAITNINQGNLKSLPLVLPSTSEQLAIAGVLRTVQRAKEACEQVLAATRQLKQSLLHHLFTYGPVPFHDAAHVPLKETEIGPICEHWNLVPCESLCEMLTVGVVVKPSSYYVESGVPAFRSFNVREDKLVTNDLVFFSRQANDGPLSKSRLREGDVLIVRTGYPGTSCVVPKQYDGANCIDLVIARPNRTLVVGEFLSRFFNSASGKQQALNAKVGLAQQHLNVGAVRRTLIPLPPLPEQREIAAQLSAVDAKLAALETRRAAVAALFQSLLHHLMTGQVRLPESAGDQR
jgi:type I restriction enzyme, S subunit